MLERRAFLAIGAMGLAPTAFRGWTETEPGERLDESSAGVLLVDPSPSFPSQDPQLVRQVVGASHGNYEAVEELVTAFPELAKANIDWGFGDWESALGAAAHTGRREIADLLLTNGARPNLFSAAMLGDLDVVRATIEARPGIQRTGGPHGITLLAHARFGGEPAAAVREYLEELGDADEGPSSEPLPDGVSPADLLGIYRYGPAEDEVLEATDRDGSIFLGRGIARGLTHLAGLAFHPAGAPSVLIEFAPIGGTARSVRVRAGGVDVTAEREA